MLSSSLYILGLICPHLCLTVGVVAEPLSVLVQFTHEHLPCAEIERAEVHGVAKVTHQLRLAAKLLTSGTDRKNRTNLMQTISINRCTIQKKETLWLRFWHKDR